MPRDDLIVFLDLETTGNTDLDEIVEVGLVLTTPEMDIIGDFSRVLAPTLDGMNRIYQRQVVFDMHTTSGLLDELKALPAKDWGEDYDDVDSEICEWLDNLTGKSTEHIPFAGSGVMHFDRKYIRRDFPKFDKRLTYWAYDSGVLRRSWQLAGLPTADRPANLVGHRALDDAYASVAEYRSYLRQLSSLKSSTR
jgi:oligoribonuclease (3'-5' exoribonuclease)